MIMKNKILIGLALLFALSFTACEPQEDDKPSMGNAPAESQMSYTVSVDQNDEFLYIFENKSTAVGIATWEIAGSRKSGNRVTHRFPLPGEYTFTLTLSNRGGASTIQGDVTTDKTDWDFLASPEMTLLSGGADAANGKSWVLDSLAWGHLGVGPAGGNGLEWWGAGPLNKAAVNVLYDDVMTFKLIGFTFNYVNNGSSYVKDFRAGDAAFSNAEQRDSDYKVDFSPKPAQWNLDKEGDTWYLYLVPSEGPIFPIFDVGAVNNRYRVITLEENKLELVATGSDGNAWHYKFIPQGYVLPVATFDIALESGTGANTYLVGLDNLVVPAGATFNKFMVDFGNGVVKESTDRNAKLSNTYMRKSPYTVKVTIVTSIGQFEHSTVIDVVENHPDYEEFLINDIIMYNNFSDVVLAPMRSGDGAVLSIVDNPSRVFPNRTMKVMHYAKNNSEWANAYLQLPVGYRFDLRNISTYKMMVYGKAGQVILLKLENTDMGGNAWQTGVELKYTIQKDDTWEIVEYNFAGAPSADLSWDPGLHAALHATDVTTDPRYSNNYYNIIRIMCNPGVGSGSHEFFFDELAGPHVEGIKSAR